MVGVKLNEAKKPGSWQVGYNYRDVESDAVLGGLTDSDFIDGGTNGKGHKLGFKYQLTKNIQTSAGFIYDLGGNFLLESWMSFPSESGREDFLTVKLNYVIKF